MSVVTISWVVCDVFRIGCAFDSGATHFVQIVDVEVLRIVETAVVTCSVALPPGRVTVVVIGWVIVVLWILESLSDAEHGLSCRAGTYISVVTTSSTFGTADEVAVMFNTGATHFVQIVDTEVLSIVEIMVVNC